MKRWGIHSIAPGNTIPVVRELAGRGRPLAGVLSVDHPTLAAEIKAISPQTIVVTRITGDQDGDFDLSARIERGDDVRVIARELFARAMARTNPDELKRADYLCLVNEPDPPGAANYHRLAQCSMALADIVRAELGMRSAHLGLNNGTPEWDECVAMAEAGLIRYIRDNGDALVVHEGAYPPDSLVPLSAGYNGLPIPGAPSVPGSGPLSFRHRYLFRAAGATCKVIVGEWYAGYGVENTGHIIEQARWYDAQCGDDVLFFAPFTGGGRGLGWDAQDYEPIYPAFVMAVLEPPQRAQGVDVSAWQDNDTTPQMMDWGRAAARGASFAFVRASVGLSPDTDFEHNVKTAQSAGLLVGAYHYMTFVHNANEQAALFWQMVGGRGLALPLMADIEAEPVPNWGADHVRAFLTALDAASGKRAGVYTRASYWDAHLFGRGLETGRPLWVAHYGVAAPRVPKGWGAWDWWQHTSQGDGPAYGAESRYIDLNVYNGTEAEMRARYPAIAQPPPAGDIFPSWTHRVIIPELPVRERPWRDGPAPRVVFTLGQGSRVEILQRDGDWGRLGLGQWVRLREGRNTEAKPK